MDVVGIILEFTSQKYSSLIPRPHPPSHKKKLSDEPTLVEFLGLVHALLHAFV